MSKQQREAVDAALRQPQQAPAMDSIDERRKGFAAFMATAAVPTTVRQKQTVLGGRPAVTVEPEAGAQPGTILYFHGGAWALGSPDTAMSITANLVARTGVVAVSLDYRLAPEDPFPAGLDDCLAAYRELLDSGTDPSTVAFAGDSAGGNFSIAACLAARAAGLPMPAAVVAFSPSLDMTLTGASMDTKAGIDPMFNRENLEPIMQTYLAGHDPRDELLSPAVVGDLTGLPPVLLQVGTNEVLLDDATRMAERARAADVDVILDVVAGVPHVFQMFAGGALDEADQALDRAASFLTQQLGNVTTARPLA
ncbi:alpha/beta hydrolase [Actinoplanes sp. NPDC089786]|uniref:alpha/beta hydrolase n=1 Tax=Actinoplanes sp. NPDC089786 TaxID=3155185 RepID=UPI00343D5854